MPRILRDRQARHTAEQNTVYEERRRTAEADAAMVGECVGEDSRRDQDRRRCCRLVSEDALADHCWAGGRLTESELSAGVRCNEGLGVTSIRFGWGLGVLCEVGDGLAAFAEEASGVAHHHVAQGR